MIFFKKTWWFCSLILLGVNTYAREKVQKSIDLENIHRVHFINIRGAVKLTGSEQTNLSIEGTLDDNALGLRTSQNKEVLIIEVEMPQHLMPVSGSKLELKLPQSMGVRIEGVSTEWQLDNLGATQIQSVTGSVLLKNGQNDVDIEVVNAPIQIEGIQGNLNLHSMNGNIQIHGVSGDIDANTIDGKIILKQQKINQVRLSTVNGVIDVSGSMSHESSLILSSVDGDLYLNLEKSDGYQCQLNALYGGKIDNQLPVSGETTVSAGGAKLSLAVGDGQGKIEATTISGTIHIK